MNNQLYLHYEKQKQEIFEQGIKYWNQSIFFPLKAVIKPIPFYLFFQNFVKEKVLERAMYNIHVYYNLWYVMIWCMKKLNHLIDDFHVYIWSLYLFYTDILLFYF